MCVFSKDGKFRLIHEGSTVLDFAFEIHSKLAYRTTGAYVNDILVPIDHILQERDKVVILESDDSFPEMSWYNIVTTKRDKKGLNGFDWEEIHYQDWKLRKEIEKSNQIAMTKDKIEDLKKSIKTMYTKQLLNLLARYRVCIDSWMWEDNPDKDSITIQLRDECIHLLKEELATREHVPNKQESKLLRQQKAKTKLSHNHGRRKI